MSHPQTHRALILDQIGQPLRVDNAYPTPQPTPGSAIVRILAAATLSYSREIYNGNRKYNLSTPCVPGNGAIGRVVALGADATTLQEGDLVLIDIFVRGRDNHRACALSGVHDGHSGPAKRMMHGEWRDGTYAEYAKLPLENCFVLDERRLLGSPSTDSIYAAATAQGEIGLGYTVEDLLHAASYLVPFGGLRDVGLGVSETVLVSPATGMFGSAAVHVALAMGANVIAMGRNTDALEKLKADVVAGGQGHHIHTVAITNNIEQEMSAIAQIGLPVDVYFDISPPAAAGATYTKSGILSLRQGGRVSLMGGMGSDVSIPINAVVQRSLALKGKWMYEREDVVRLIHMVESGRLRLGKKGIIGRFGLEQWKQAFDAAAEQSGPGQMAVIVP
ncbi:hypothetical protein UA08_01865 [Talaromyces atroroseus]|uniref:Alcohol dehydrogenase-like C-terminal domain-containing protein n=1 Tax=Talaromyces atroroseus TaxID=1441469 RepID=A0A1Q5QBM3_TALAT|nr:hypothetical protein UA08_01865 [Talaromyces atroroseus]OKL63281.1 hypothetical protein UA08_01865 [Talaromyces atroroseus]